MKFCPLLVVWGVVFGLLKNFALQNKLEHQRLPKKILTLGPARRRNTKHLLCCNYQQILAEHLIRTPDKKMVWTNDPSLVTSQHLAGSPGLQGSSAVQAGSGESSRNCKVVQIPSNQKFQLQIQRWLKRLEFTGASERECKFLFFPKPAKHTLFRQGTLPGPFLLWWRCTEKKTDLLFPELPIPHGLKSLGDIFNQYF